MVHRNVVDFSFINCRSSSFEMLLICFQAFLLSSPSIYSSAVQSAVEAGDWTEAMMLKCREQPI